MRFMAIARSQKFGSPRRHLPVFCEGQVSFEPAKPPAPEPVNDPVIARAASKATCTVQDDGLRHALETLGKNVLSKEKRNVQT